MYEGRAEGPAFITLARLSEALRQRDRLVRADGLTGAALGAVIGACENGNVLKIERARGALVNADSACGAEVGIDDGLAHTQRPFTSGTARSAVRCSTT